MNEIVFPLRNGTILDKKMLCYHHFGHEYIYHCNYMTEAYMWRPYIKSYIYMIYVYKDVDMWTSYQVPYIYVCSRYVQAIGRLRVCKPMWIMDTLMHIKRMVMKQTSYFPFWLMKHMTQPIIWRRSRTSFTKRDIAKPASGLRHEQIITST